MVYKTNIQHLNQHFKMDKKSVGKLSVIILIGLVLSVSLYFVLADEPQTERIENNRKIIENDGVIISAKIVEHCFWKPDSINDGYKICDAIIEGYNPNYTLTVDIFKFLLDKDAQVKDKKYNVYFSTQFELYNETLSNETCFDECIDETEFYDCEKDCSFEIERKRFYNWTYLGDKVKTTYDDTNFAYKINFEFPQYESAYYDFEISYKKEGGGEIEILLDPEISACGFVDSGGTYTLSQDISNIAGNCFTFRASDIIFDMNGKTLTGNGEEPGGQSNYGFWVINGVDNAVIKNGNINNFGVTAITIFSGSDNIEIKDININTGNYGVYDHGIDIVDSVNNVLENITITGTNGVSEGINMWGDDYLSSKNKWSDITISETRWAIGFWYVLDNNLTNFSFYDNLNGVYFQDGASNNLLKDGKISSTTVDVTITPFETASINNVFLNVTYDKVKEDVSSGCSLYRKWYYRTYVNDSNTGSALEGINITAYNITGTPQFNFTTDDTGYTPQTEIFDYYRTGGVTTYYSNYTIYAQNISYPTISHLYDVTVNENNFNDVFSLDNVHPYINITSPTNGTSSSDNTLDVEYTFADTNIASCWYSNDTFTLNTSITCGVNITDITWTDGKHIVRVWTNDTAGNTNSSNVTFFIDTIPPDYRILNPVNTNYYSQNFIHINLTSTNFNACVVSLNSGLNNYSLSINSSSTGGNYSNTSIADGDYTITAYCNDTVGNTNSTQSTTFTIDTTNPLISYGTGTELNETNFTRTWIYVYANVTETNEKNITFRLYHRNGTQVNITTYSTAQRVVNWTGLNDGFYNYNISVWDGASNYNETRTRRITLDNANPLLDLYRPLPQNYATNQSLPLNFTVSDETLGVQSCWYRIFNSTDIITSNTTVPDCANMTFNVTKIDGIGEGAYTLTFYVNDTLNNINSSSVTFGLSFTAPSTVLDYPTDGLWLNTGVNSHFNFTSTDVNGLDTCRLYHNATGTWHKNFTWKKPNSGVQNYTNFTLTDTEFVWNVWCNDTSNNGDWALNNFTFGVDTIFPEINLSSISTTVDSKMIYFNSTTSDTNTLSCKYSIYNATGSLDGTNENISYTCNVRGLAAVQGNYGTYNLTIYSSDLASNENKTTKEFTITYTTPSSLGGGGEPTPPEEEEEPEIIIEAKAICGNGLCESGESFYSCPSDCGGLNLDDLIFSCFAGNPIGDWLDVEDTPEIKSRCITNQSPVLFWIFIITISGVSGVIVLEKQKAKGKIYKFPQYYEARRKAKSWLRRAFKKRK